MHGNRIGKNSRHAVPERLDEVLHTDPINGQVYTLWEIEQFPTTRKGNRPGYTSAGFLSDYWQEYYGLVATFNRRFADGWDMRASYTYSVSEGLNPRALSQWRRHPQCSHFPTPYRPARNRPGLGRNLPGPAQDRVSGNCCST